MPVALTGTSRIGLIGDSITATFAGSAPWLGGFGPLLRAQYGQNIVPGSSVLRMPQFYVNAVAGRAVGTISGSIATILAGFPKNLDVLLVQLGINDADNLRTGSAPTIDLPTLTTQVNTVIAAYAAMVPKPQLWWIGPWAHDSGDDVAQIATVDNLLGNASTGLVVAAGGTYTRWSGISNGGGNAMGDGTHPTSTGITALGAAAFASCAFSP